MGERVYNVLFLCTGNSARSILAEAILGREGHGRFRSYSAGSFPKGQVHPAAHHVLGNLGYDTSGFRSKSWDEFAGADAPRLDFIFTVCDNAAGEVCPVWPGQPMTAHWGIPDPAAVEGSDAVVRAAFFDAYRMMKNRIDLFLALPLASIERMSLLAKLDRIGRDADAAAHAG
jgi:protein-tyrosine-phosphatase